MHIYYDRMSSSIVEYKTYIIYYSMVQWDHTCCYKNMMNNSEMKPLANKQNHIQIIPTYMMYLQT
jgi:hypothetical protein